MDRQGKRKKKEQKSFFLDVQIMDRTEPRRRALHEN